MIELTTLPLNKSLQSNFEIACVTQMGLNLGVLALDLNNNKYCNMHVQWLWSQFSKDYQGGQLVVDAEGNAVKDEEGFVTYTNVNLG